MVHDIPDWESFWWIPPQGGPQAYEEATSEIKGCRICLPPGRGRDGRGGIAGGVDLHLLPPEHSRTFYSYQANYVLVSGGVAEARVKVDQGVVVAGRIGCGGGADGRLGGGTDGEGWGD